MLAFILFGISIILGIISLIDVAFRIKRGRGFSWLRKPQYNSGPKIIHHASLEFFDDVTEVYNEYRSHRKAK